MFDGFGMTVSPMTDDDRFVAQNVKDVFQPFLVKFMCAKAENPNFSGSDQKYQFYQQDAMLQAETAFEIPEILP